MTDKITEGVGKRIVDALKQQSDAEIKNVTDNAVENIDDSTDYSQNFENVEDDFEYNNDESFQKDFSVNQTMNFERPSVNNDIFTSDLNDFEVPNNVAVLKQLINQLPAGVSKQTGAQIIKQTMEALGISMKNVLQEAQQVQESLNNSSKECQASIIEYKKQINLLERQSQKLQKQYSALNDIISLFVQTNI